ncbi:MAG: hypothetical protein M3Z25_15235 [Actinomycetota bacterium]|nr:hypothetical protein [Actinomycetota bacterium]
MHNYNVFNPSGPMSWNGTNYSQTVNNGLDTQTILQGAQQLRQLLSEAQGLAEDDQTVLHGQVAEIEAEVVKQDADPSKIRTLLTSIRQRLMEAVTKAAATEAVDAARDQLPPLVHQLLQARGLS